MVSGIAFVEMESGCKLVQQYLAALAVVEDHKETAHYPACGIGESHKQETIGKTGGNEQVDLSEYNIRAQENDHGASAVTHASQAACENLGKGIGHQKRAHAVHDERAVSYDLGFAVEQGDQGFCEYYDDDRYKKGNAE